MSYDHLRVSILFINISKGAIGGVVNLTYLFVFNIRDFKLSPKFFSKIYDLCCHGIDVSDG